MCFIIYFVAVLFDLLLLTYLLYTLWSCAGYFKALYKKSWTGSAANGWGERRQDKRPNCLRPVQGILPFPQLDPELWSRNWMEDLPLVPHETEDLSSR